MSPPRPRAPRRAGAVIDSADPLAVLDHGRSGADEEPGAPPPTPDGAVALRAPMQGTVVAIEAEAGAAVARGRAMLVMESMKMEHVIAADAAGLVREFVVAVGDTVFEGDILAFVEPREVADEGPGEGESVDVEAIRPDLEGIARPPRSGARCGARASGGAPPQDGHRTARENIDDLCDPGSFVEYGALAIAAQRQRRPVDDLIRRTPADGLVAGIGRVNGDAFPRPRVALRRHVLRLHGPRRHPGVPEPREEGPHVQLAEKWRLPLVLFAEGGGGRPGDTDGAPPAGAACRSVPPLSDGFSGVAPLVGVASGRCFAGNAALFGCCDVTIATADATIGMGGPAMIEGGGLGVFRPEEVGPMSVQRANGVVDIAVADEAEAVSAGREDLSLVFPGRHGGRRTALTNACCAPPFPRTGFASTMSGASSNSSPTPVRVLELRRDFGPGIVTALVRVEGRALGLIANNPRHLAGAIDSDGADKAARFMQLCDAHGLPILVLCDTPGMMVGPEVEKTALVRHCCRLFVTGANLETPVFAIVLRKAYGLGAQAMVGGGFRAPLFTVSWPTGEFGGMGLEGFVKLGYRKELEAVADPAERKALFDEMVARAYEHGKALNVASHFEFDDVIDPRRTRAAGSSAGLESLPAAPAPRRQAPAQYRYVVRRSPRQPRPAGGSGALSASAGPSAPSRVSTVTPPTCPAPPCRPSSSGTV